MTEIPFTMINEVMSCSKSLTEPKVGMGATMFVGSDRYAMVVTEVLTPKKIKVTHIDDADEDKFVTIDGVMFLPDDNMKKYLDLSDGHGLFNNRVYTYRKNHRWMPQGEGCWGTSAIHLGHAENFMDPCF